MHLRDIYTQKDRKEPHNFSNLLEKYNFMQKKQPNKLRTKYPNNPKCSMMVLIVT